MSEPITYETDLGSVDWAQLKATLAADRFDNGRTPEQLRRSFEGSFAAVLAYADAKQVVGTARVLSDGVCNAYVVDMWTHSAQRRRGIGRAMLARLESRLTGQHVYLFTDAQVEFYRRCGYEIEHTGLGRVIGRWLHPVT